MPETESAVETIPPLTSLTEEETMLRDTVRQFAQQEIAPRVREMDEAQKLDPGILRQLFELGLMAIEAPLDLGGAGASFFSAVLAVEEISRVDPAVAVIVDVQNTLAVNALLRWGNAGAAAALASADGREDRLRLCAERSWIGLRRILALHPGARRRRRLCPERSKTLDLQRHGGRPVSGLRDGESRGGLSRHHRFSCRARHAGLRRRPQRRQDGHSRLIDLRAALRRLPRARGECGRRGGQGLQDRHRNAERRPHRHRCADAGPGRGRVVTGREVQQGAQAVRQSHRGIPGRAVCPRRDGHPDRSHPHAGLQRCADESAPACRL